jgi:hypothetical protein
VQSVSLPPSADAHELPHTPFWQTFPAVHATPQAPQFALSVFVLVQ